MKSSAKLNVVSENQGAVSNSAALPALSSLDSKLEVADVKKVKLDDLSHSITPNFRVKALVTSSATMEGYKQIVSATIKKGYLINRTTSVFSQSNSIIEDITQSDEDRDRILSEMNLNHELALSEYKKGDY